MEHTKEYESPNSFWTWGAYATLAAVIRDKVYKKSGDSLTFPNIYVLLLADSGVSRKGRPIELSTKLLYDIQNTKIISGRASIQAVLEELSRVETSKHNGKIIQGGSGILYAPELAAGLVSDIASVGILTDIYDYRTNYSQLLKSSGKVTIEKIVFSLFGASNLALLKEVFDARALQGGLLARTFLVTPDEYRPPNSLTGDTSNKQDTYTPMLNQLKEVLQIQGEIRFTPEGSEEYDKWYKPFYNRMQREKDPTGVYGRLQTSILKLSMILAVNDLTLFIDKHHVEEAIDKCMGLLPNYKQLMAGQGKSTIAEAGQLVLAKLLNSAEYTSDRSSILRDHWADFDAETLDKLIITLDQGGLVQQVNSGTKQAYRLTPKCVSMLKGKEVVQ